jgi:hypothetical protein
MPLKCINIHLYRGDEFDNPAHGWEEFTQAHIIIIVRNLALTAQKRILTNPSKTNVLEELSKPLFMGLCEFFS